MKTYIVFCFSVLLFFNSCKKEAIPGAICGVKNPVEELPWLKNLTQDAVDNNAKYGSTGIAKSEWKGKTIFMVYRLLSSCIGCEAYYCNGTKLDVEGMPEDEREEFYEKIVNQIQHSDLIWEFDKLK